MANSKKTIVLSAVRRAPVDAVAGIGIVALITLLVPKREGDSSWSFDFEEGVRTLIVAGLLAIGFTIKRIYQGFRKRASDLAQEFEDARKEEEQRAQEAELRRKENIKSEIQIIKKAKLAISLIDRLIEKIGDYRDPYLRQLLDEHNWRPMAPEVDSSRFQDLNDLTAVGYGVGNRKYNVFDADNPVEGEPELTAFPGVGVSRFHNDEAARIEFNQNLRQRYWRWGVRSIDYYTAELAEQRVIAVANLSAARDALEILDPDVFYAVMANKATEFDHLFDAHGRISEWNIANTRI